MMKTKIIKLVDRLRREKILPVKCSVENGAMLEGKNALIIGGSGGLGSAIAKEFVKQGCKVVISGTNELKLKQVSIEIGSCEYILLDVTKIDSIYRSIESASEKCNGRIDILVNAMGVNGNFKFGEISEYEYNRVMDINLRGSYFLCQSMGNYMIKNKIKGHILNISSSSAVRPAWTPYQISKWAIKGMTLGFADKLLPYGIIVNAIAPGPVATSMLGIEEGGNIDMENQPSGRYALPEEVACLATYMVSDLGNLIVGDTFYITGGSGIISLHN